MFVSIDKLFCAAGWHDIMIKYNPEFRHLCWYFSFSSVVGVAMDTLNWILHALRGFLIFMIKLKHILQESKDTFAW